MLPLVFAIAVAGALGAVARWGLTAAIHRVVGGNFPTGTLVVNLLGCFALGLGASLLAERAHWPLVWRTAILTGFLGAFTTFSTFSFDTVELLRSAHYVKAAVNVSASVGLGLLAAAIGVALGLRWTA